METETRVGCSQPLPSPLALHSHGDLRSSKLLLPSLFPLREIPFCLSPGAGSSAVGFRPHSSVYLTLGAWQGHVCSLGECLEGDSFLPRLLHTVSPSFLQIAVLKASGSSGCPSSLFLRLPEPFCFESHNECTSHCCYFILELSHVALSVPCVCPTCEFCLAKTVSQTSLPTMSHHSLGMWRILDATTRTSAPQQAGEQMQSARKFGGYLHAIEPGVQRAERGLPSPARCVPYPKPRHSSGVA
ncbi:uncharacterized protein LOC121044490 [Herpailurus yagouaroundi]|uniref:uncharacterized protein LOC121044490 n=1 Tax=Herpailurus yagouaroundi TaxID=1608482 RepID=UPI001AD72198|nr:uncharacterized protein LOC121044490 [Puma yagouaroundi]